MDTNIQQDITPEEAFASLGVATHLNEQLLKAKHTPPEPMDNMSEQENERGMMESMPESEPQNEAELDSKIEEKVTKIVKEEMSSFKEELRNMLNEE